MTLENADRGRNLGIELEFRKRLGMIADVLEPLFVGGNFALIDSEVQLKTKGVATEDHRPLAGQSQYIVNASIGWDDPESRTSVTLLYNVSGERLVACGSTGRSSSRPRTSSARRCASSRAAGPWSPTRRGACSARA